MINYDLLFDHKRNLECWFLKGEENRRTWIKIHGVRTRSNYRLDPHGTGPGIEPGPQLATNGRATNSLMKHFLSILSKNLIVFVPLWYSLWRHLFPFLKRETSSLLWCIFALKFVKPIASAAVVLFHFCLPHCPVVWKSKCSCNLQF